MAVDPRFRNANEDTPIPCGVAVKVIATPLYLVLTFVDELLLTWLC